MHTHTIDVLVAESDTKDAATQSDTQKKPSTENSQVPKQDLKQAPEGWNWLSNTPKWHYFRDCRSLCGRWGILGTQPREFQQGNDESKDNCSMCKKKILAEKAKVSGVETLRAPPNPKGSGIRAGDLL